MAKFVEVRQMTHSLDFRKRAVTLFREGEGKSSICRTFGIARSTLNRWLAAKTLSPRKAGPKGPRKIADEALVAHVEAHPDAFQYERAKVFGVSRFVVLHRLKRLGIKKNAALPRKRRQASQ